MPESNLSVQGSSAPNQSQASLDAREISDSASLTRQEKVDIYWKRKHRNPETRGQRAIQVIPQDWGWKTSGMSESIFKRLNPDALTSRTVTVDNGDPKSAGETGGFWTLDHPTDVDGNWNGYGRNRGVEMYIVFPKDYLVDNEDAVYIASQSPTDIHFKRGAQFTIVGVEDVTIAEPARSENNDKMYRSIYQWQWKRYIMVPKGYEERYYHDVDASTTDPAAKEELSRHRKGGTLLQSTRHVALQGLQVKEGLVWQQVTKGDTRIALPVIPQNHIDKFLYEAYSRIASSDGKMRDVNSDTMLNLLAGNHAEDVADDRATASASDTAPHVSAHVERTPLSSEMLAMVGAKGVESRELLPMEGRQNGEVLIDDEDHLAERLWQPDSRFYFGSLHGQFPEGVGYRGVGYVAILTVDEKGDQHIFAVNNPMYGTDMAVVGRTLQGGDVLLPPQNYGQLDIYDNVDPITVGQELKLSVRATENPDDRTAPLRQVGVGRVDRILIVYDTGLNTFMQRQVDSKRNDAHRLAQHYADRLAERFDDEQRDYTLSSFRVTARGAGQGFSDVQRLLPPQH